MPLAVTSSTSASEMITQSLTDDYGFKELGPSGPFLVLNTKLRFISGGIIREIVTQTVSLRRKLTGGVMLCSAFAPQNIIG